MLAGWMMNPWLFAAGGFLVAAPILIHLLNKRKFRIVDWAAMDFLLEADQRNRRRVQIEEMVLLALRCLAMLLAGLFVARPFVPSSLGRGLFQSSRTERIVLLDDSPSMEATSAGSSPFRMAKRQVADFVTALAEQGAGDSLTLYLTSRPDRPVVRDTVVDNSSAPALVADIEALSVSDLPARLDRAFVAVRGFTQGRSDRINRVAYVVSDLRRGDWSPEASDAAKDQEAPVADALAALSKDLSGCFVVDCGDDGTANIGIVEIVPEDKALLAGVSTRFQVTVKNFGADPLRDVPVKLTAGGGLPMTASISSIPAGGTGSVPFSYSFAAAANDDDETPPVEITAEAGVVAGDLLAADNVRYFAARVKAGIPTLIVDGDPSSEFGHSESFFVERALAPPGTTRSGIRCDVVNDVEFGAASLAAHQAVYLCNVYHLDEHRLKSLEEWVKAGGGLVVFPGGQVDAQFYNDALYRDGKGLLPRRMQTVAGDETEKTWSTLSIEQAEHPTVRIFSGDAAPLLQAAKFYQWWSLPEAGDGNVILRLTDNDRSPALVERSFGRGRVMQFAIPADADWSNWPEDASYLIVLQELNRYLAQTATTPGQATVGEPVSEPLDLSRFRAEVNVTRPDATTNSLVAVAGDSKSADAPPNLWRVKLDDLSRRGFYRIGMTTPERATRTALWAANLPASEGDLARIDSKTLAASWQSAPIELVGNVELAGLTAAAARGELWFAALLLLIVVLFAEQGLAWLFGRSR